MACGRCKPEERKDPIKWPGSRWQSVHGHISRSLKSEPPPLLTQWCPPSLAPRYTDNSCVYLWKRPFLLQWQILKKHCCLICIWDSVGKGQTLIVTGEKVSQCGASNMKTVVLCWFLFLFFRFLNTESDGVILLEKVLKTCMSNCCHLQKYSILASYKTEKGWAEWVG